MDGNTEIQLWVSGVRDINPQYTGFKKLFESSLKLVNFKAPLKAAGELATALVALCDDAASLSLAADASLVDSASKVVSMVRVLDVCQRIMKVAAAAVDGPQFRAALVKEVQPSIKDFKLKPDCLPAFIYTLFTTGLNMVMPA